MLLLQWCTVNKRNEIKQVLLMGLSRPADNSRKDRLALIIGIIKSCDVTDAGCCGLDAARMQVAKAGG